MHYVPVAHDFSNLTAAVEWCEATKNAGACERIGTAGREYMNAHGFMNVGLNRALGGAVTRAAVREHWEELKCWERQWKKTRIPASFASTNSGGDA